MEALEDALVVNPPNVPPAMLHLELGRVYYKLGFERRAKDALTKVTTLDKNGSYGSSRQGTVGTAEAVKRAIWIRSAIFSSK